MVTAYQNTQNKSIIPRDTGVGILTGLDDVQQQLDDHIMKSQTMRGSPYVKAFEADMTAWEEKLISMQDILDQWLQVTCCKNDIRNSF
jgi:dynein heavy chain, axonemal